MPTLCYPVILSRHVALRGKSPQDYLCHSHWTSACPWSCFQNADSWFLHPGLWCPLQPLWICSHVTFPGDLCCAPRVSYFLDFSMSFLPQGRLPCEHLVLWDPVLAPTNTPLHEEFGNDIMHYSHDQYQCKHISFFPIFLNCNWWGSLHPFCYNT